jgi:RecA-family ATPase
MGEPSVSQPIPDDPGYWAIYAEEANYIPDGIGAGFVDSRPQAFAPVGPAPVVELLPQLVTDGLINLEAEQEVLGALLQDNSLWRQHCAGLTYDDFSEPLHQRIYAALESRISTGHPATPITLWPMFAKDEAMQVMGGLGYLAQCTGSFTAVIGIADNVRHLKDLADRRRLAGVAQSVAQALAEPDGDISGALAQLDEARKQVAAGNAPMATVCMASLHEVEVAPRQWVVKQWLPANAVTYLGGPGGVGKSLLVQQWLTAISLGESWIGMETLAPVPCLYVTCEDEADEVARRNADIAKALGYSIRALTDMHCISLAGAEGNELGTFDAERRFRPSERFHRIVAAAKALRVRVVALDNLAHMFTGNENVRGEVTQFVNLLSRLALEIGGAVILLGHPAKVEGSEYSGSTAWENAVRNRLFLGRPEAKGEGDDVNPNARHLSRSKSNYAAIGEGVDMVWSKGAFIPASEVPEDEAPIFEAAGLHNELFLERLEQCAAKKRAVSHNVRASNYAPRIFAKMPGKKRASQAQFEAAMERLLAMGMIVLDAEMPFRDSSRRPVIGIGKAP